MNRTKSDFRRPSVHLPPLPAAGSFCLHGCCTYTYVLRLRLFLATRAIVDPHIVAIAVATLDVSCSCHRCLPVAAIAVATWDVFSLLVVLPPSSCHHGLYHLGVFLLLPLGLLLLLVPMLTLILRTNIAIATLDCSCCSWSCLPHLVTMADTTLEFSC